MADFAFPARMFKPAHLLTDLTIAAALLLVSLGTHAASSGVGAELGIGNATPEAQGYRGDLAVDAALGYRRSQWHYRLGVTRLGEHRLRGTDDTHIDVVGAYMQVNRVFSAPWLDIELGGGALYSYSDAVFGGSSIRKDRDLSPYVDARLVKHLNPPLSLQFGYRYFHDVSGSDIQAVQVGLRYTF